MRVAVLGAGHVGLTTALCLAHCGHDLTLVDVDTTRVRLLAQGELPFFEPYLAELFARVKGHLRLTSDYDAVADADVCIIAVPSPTAADGGVDLTFVRNAAVSIGRSLRRRRVADPVLVVNKCTVPVGTGRLVSELIAGELAGEDGQGGQRPEFSLGSCPEFLREGHAVFDTMYPDRIVFGVDREADGRRLGQLYQAIIERRFPEVAPELSAAAGTTTVMTTSITSAELIKYAANGFLALKLSFINEIAAISSAVGASIQDVARGIGLDRRIGRSFLNAGIGWGGSCLGKDLSAFISTSREYGLPTQVLDAALAVNERQRGVVIRLLQQELRLLKGSRIGLLGLAFKPGTDDLRDAPSLDIARRLLALGASVSGYDPVVREVPVPGVTMVADVRALAHGSDALLLITEWEEFAGVDWAALAATMRQKIMIDGRNLLDPSQLERAGFRYRAIGR